jgi:carbamoyl-phosphate synthase large subunit
MRYTGEVMGLDKTYDMAFAKAQLGAGMRIPKSGTVFVSVKESDRIRVLPSIKKLVELGFQIKATGGNHAFFESKGVPSTKINKVLEGRPHVVDAIKNGDIQLVLNTTETRSSESDSKSIRQTAVMQKVPYYTTLPGILSATKAIAAQKADAITVRPLQDYF